MNNETIVVGIKNENIKHKVKLLKEIISASPSAKKIFSDELDIDNIINTSNKLELSPILSYNSDSIIQKVDNSSINNNMPINNENLNENENGNNVVTQPNIINKNNENNEIEPELNSEETEKVKSWLKENDKNNLLKSSFNNKEHNTYSKLSQIYNLKKKEVDVSYIKNKIQNKVLGTIEYSIFKDYIETLDSKSKSLLTKFMNNLSFRFKLNQEIKEMPLKSSNTKKTKKRNHNNDLTKKNINNNQSTNILLDIISKSPKIKKDIIVFKHIGRELGNSIIDEIKNKKGEDIIIEDKTVSVCHYNPLEELAEDTMIIKISVRKNTKCLVVCPENGFLYKDSEILLSPLSKIKILRTRNIEIPQFKTVILEAELI